MEREFHVTEIKDDARIDFRWKARKGRITFFAINLSLLEEHKRQDVYRVDAAHGYLHEQRFWRSPKPIRLEEMNYNTAFTEKKKEVLENFERWIALFKKTRGDSYG